MMKIKNVAFLGYADAVVGDELYGQVFATAKLLAREGYTIVNGGGPGVMKASSEGAHAGGGKVTGVTFYPQETTHYEGRDPTNPLDREIKTANYLARTLKLLELSDTHLFFNGGTGTLSEFGMAWGLARLYFGKHKPLILFGEFWHAILEAIAANMLLRPEELKVYTIVTAPQAVLAEIKEIEKRYGASQGISNF